MVVDLRTAPRAKQTIHVKRLTDLPVKFLIPALQEELQHTILDANLVQTRLGNDPTRVIIDGRKASGTLTEGDQKTLERAGRARQLVFPNAKRRITFTYGDTARLAEAVTFAWNWVGKLMRKKKNLTGAWGSTYMWLSDPGTSRKLKTRNPLEASNFILKSSDEVWVHILGPRTEYRRHVIYSPKGKQQVKTASLSRAFSRPGEKALNPYSFLNEGSKVGREYKARGGGLAAAITKRKRKRSTKTTAVAFLPRSIHEMVKLKVKRKFGLGIYATYRFTSIRVEPTLKLYNSPRWRPDGPNRFVPVLALRLGNKGTDLRSRRR